MNLQLDGKTALVTGASTGIGRGIASALAREGVQLAIAARRGALLEELAAEIVAAGGPPAVVVEVDFYAPESIQKLREAVLKGLGHVDIVINNAGGSRPFTDLHVDEDRWEEALTLNFHRPRQLADALLDQMIARKWGRIVNITGNSEPRHINGAFCAKAGLHSWAKGLSRMVGKYGVTINSIAPGRINSEQILRNYTTEERQQQSENDIPMGRYGDPSDLANLACFIASPLASYITGTVIPVDGGLRRYQF
ncbi:MAG: SDR family oxidoreductase [Pusillimonas sp.]